MPQAHPSQGNQVIIIQKAPMEFGRRPIRLDRFEKAAKLLVLLPLAVFLLAGCEKGDWGGALKETDSKVGEIFNNFQKTQQDAAINIFNKKAVDEKATSSALTDEQKAKIDDWLDEKGFNRYGDSKNAVYTGGTPLFDEKTGKAIDRYDYILSKYPNLLEELKIKK